jgi:hypothetical protein
VTLFTSNVIGWRGHVTMTWRSVMGRGRGHVSDVIQLLQSNWAAQVAASLLRHVCFGHVFSTI